MKGSQPDRPEADGAAAFVRRGFDLWNRGDFEGFLQTLDRDVLWKSPPEAPDGAVEYRGHDGVRAWMESLFDAWEYLHIDITKLLTSGDQAMVIAQVRGKAKGSGMELEIPWAYRLVHDGERLQLFEQYLDVQHAIDAVQPANLIARRRWRKELDNHGLGRD